MCDEKTWGMNIEISVIATMFQAIIVLFGQYPSRCGWILCPPPYVVALVPCSVMILCKRYNTPARDTLHL